MDELSRASEKLRSSLSDPEWNGEREHAILAGVKREWSNGQARRRWPALAAAAVLLVATGTVLAIEGRSFWSAKKVAEAPAMGTVTQQEVSREVVLRDGSIARLIGENSAVRVDKDEPAFVSLTLLSGGAHFDVTHNEQRAFHVLAGDVVVEVVGTIFRVEYTADLAIRVSVDRGRVKVQQGSRTAEVAAGDSIVFPGGPSVAAKDPAAAGNADDSPPSPSGASSADPARTRWRALARDGQYEAAYDAFNREGAAALLPDEPGALLLAADVARLSGHPADAVAPLRKLVAHHRADPRAAAGAFTLGKVLLDDLGRASEAARTFAQVSSLDSAGSLSEDALSHEVEAWARAGEDRRAHERAAAYVARFPNGAHLRMVRKVGGLD